MLSPRSSRPSSPNRSRSTSASSSLNPPSGGKSPRTPPPIISCVSPADMHAHAIAAEHSWGPDEMSIYDAAGDIDVRPHFEPDGRRAHEMSRPEDIAPCPETTSFSILFPLVLYLLLTVPAYKFSLVT
ncbi:hypothetical protein BN14_08509 [Rhizoctonia solani AG-1 IB]|uniref:Uncharacterized protein n=1 Tax=Thanatephorus cucumeris (strain AG1-IB / isolate 7/3/14) TaxID=1108050 RepID=M5C4R6_THACB|nr:hypothetical protein BN14_08509 [Rhizoctonia solani AG-1 IB]